MIPAALLLAFVTAERLAELWYARRNTAALMAQGAVEFGAGHYPLIVALHAAWLGGLWIGGWDSPVENGWLAVFLAIQVLRVWTIATLGRRWTTRIVVLPNAPLAPQLCGCRGRDCRAAALSRHAGLCSRLYGAERRRPLRAHPCGRCGFGRCTRSRSPLIARSFRHDALARAHLNSLAVRPPRGSRFQRGRTHRFGPQKAFSLTILEVL